MPSYKDFINSKDIIPFLLKDEKRIYIYSVINDLFTKKVNDVKKLIVQKIVR